MLSTKDLQVSSGKTPKTLRPGNVIAKVTGIYLQAQKSKPENYFLIMNLEGEDMGADFEGFLYDSDNPQLGRAKGQVARVKYSQFSYRDMVSKAGQPIARDTQILRDIVSLASALGVREKLDEIEALTIEKFVEQASKVLNNGIFLYWCIGGAQYMKDNGNKDYALNLPKYERGVSTANYANLSNKAAVTPFNGEKHVQDDTIKSDAPVAGWDTSAPKPEATTPGSWTPSGFEM